MNFTPAPLEHGGFIPNTREGIIAFFEENKMEAFRDFLPEAMTKDICKTFGVKSSGIDFMRKYQRRGYNFGGQKESKKVYSKLHLAEHIASFFSEDIPKDPKARSNYQQINTVKQRMEKATNILTQELNHGQVKSKSPLSFEGTPTKSI